MRPLTLTRASVRTSAKRPDVGLAGDRAGSSEAESEAGETGRGFGIAYAYLNKRERTVAEVRARLKRAEVAVREVDAVIAELVEFGYLDDARYARVFTEDKRALEAWGNERIARTLRERGVARELIELALAEDVWPPGGALPDGARAWDDQREDWEDVGGSRGGGGEFERAAALLGRRFPGGPATPRDRERAFRMLARKGYESETATDAVREWARRAVV